MIKKPKLLHVFYAFVAILLFFKSFWEQVFGFHIHWGLMLILGATAMFFQVREHRKNGTLKNYLLFVGTLLFSLLAIMYFHLRND